VDEGPSSSRQVRVGDPERQQVAELLRRHTADGRLTLDEFSARVGLALAARTRADLDVLTSDLPSVPEAVPEIKRKKARRWVVAVMSEAVAKGRWRTGRTVTAVAFMGKCELDFRRAEIDHDEVTVTAVALMGSTEILVPEGIDVELTGVPIMGAKRLRLPDVPTLPGSPRIVIRAFPVMGDVTVRSRPQRRDDELPASAPAHRDRRDRPGERRDRPGEERERPGPDARQRRRARREESRDMARELERRYRAGEAIDLDDIYDVVFSRLGSGRPAETASPASAPPAAPVPAPGQPSPPTAGDPAGPIDRAAVRAGEDPDGAGDSGIGDLPGTLDGTVTIMFSDIAGYTAINDRLGDLAAHDLLNQHNRIVRDLLVTHRGYEVKSQGDGFMIAFSSAGRALRCAIAIQQAFEKYSLEHPDEPVRVHLGLHTGEAVRDGDDFLGRTVIVASRLTSLAGPGEILVSSLLRELAEPSHEFRFGPPREVSLKGVSVPQIISPVIWTDA
jgi:class 3 adenylate cyclase